MINNIQNLMDQLVVEYGVSEDFLLDILIKAIEQAWINDAGEGYVIGMEVQQSKYGNNLRCYRILEVVEEVETPQNQISVKEAQLIDPQVLLGHNIKMDLDLSNISRNGAKIAEKYINQHMFQKKKHNEFEYFSDKVGTIVSGVIKAKSTQGIVVDFYGFEGIITDYKPYQFNQSEFPIGAKIKAYVYKLEENTEGFQVFLSRNNEEFLVALLEEEVHEIKSGLVKIMGIARNPGFASVVLVKSEDEFNKLNAVSVCIGSGGQRIKNIQKELRGEKISIVPWKDLLFARVATVLNHKIKIDIKKIILHDEEGDRYVEIIVPQDQISRLIGIRGRNIDLMSRALGEKLKINSDDSSVKVSNFSSYMSNDEREKIMDEFMSILHINQEDGESLINSGIVSINSIVEMSFNDFLLIPLISNNHGQVYNKALENSTKKISEAQDSIAEDNDGFIEENNDGFIEENNDNSIEEDYENN